MQPDVEILKVGKYHDMIQDVIDLIPESPKARRMLAYATLIGETRIAQIQRGATPRPKPDTLEALMSQLMPGVSLALVRVVEQGETDAAKPPAP